MKQTINKRNFGNEHKIIVSLIIILSIITRVVFLIWDKNIPAGDTFNFLFIAEKLQHFSYIRDERRLPFYPFLLMIGEPFLDGVVWAKIISLSSVLLSLILFYLLLARFKIKKEITLVSLVLFSFQPTYFFTSIRPMADSLYIALLLLAFYLYYSKEMTNKHLYGLGLNLGLLSMTRFEGFLVSLIIFLFVFLREKVKIKYSLIVYLLVIAPWFIRNTVVFNNPFYSVYFQDFAVLNKAKLMEFISSIHTSIGYVSNLWETAGIVFMILGLLYVLRNFRKLYLPIIVYIVFHLFLVTYLFVYSRYFSQLIPYLSLFIALGIYFIRVILFKKEPSEFVKTITSLIVVVFIFYPILKKQPNWLKSYNTDGIYGRTLSKAVGSLRANSKVLFTDETLYPLGPRDARYFLYSVYYLRDRAFYLLDKPGRTLLVDTHPWNVRERLFFQEKKDLQTKRAWLSEKKPEFLIISIYDPELNYFINSKDINLKLIGNFAESNSDTTLNLYALEYNQ